MTGPTTSRRSRGGCSWARPTSAAAPGAGRRGPPRRPDIVDRHPTTMLAISGMTAWGIALFSYLVNRSAEHIIPYVSPAIRCARRPVAVAGPTAQASESGARGQRAALVGALFAVHPARRGGLARGRRALLAVRARPCGAREATPPPLPSTASVIRTSRPHQGRRGQGAPEERYMPDEDSQHRPHRQRPDDRHPPRAERGSVVPLGDPIRGQLRTGWALRPAAGVRRRSRLMGTLMLRTPGAREVSTLYRADPSTTRSEDQATMQRVAHLPGSIAAVGCPRDRSTVRSAHRRNG